MFTKWLGFGRKSDVTITACEADGGTVEDSLWYKEMSRFNLRGADEKLKLAKRWGKAEEYASWVDQEAD
jgi:hypothetical protein